MKLSLSDLIALHANSGRRPLNFAVKGHVDLVVRNADGSVDQAVSKPNLATSLWNDQWAYSVNRTSMRVVILPDDNGDVSPYKTAGHHLYSSNYDIAATATLNSSTSTWTWTAVFGVPSVDRTFRYVGLKADGAVGTDGNARSAPFIFSMSRMSSNISQSTAQTLEIVYRVSFSRV